MGKKTAENDKTIQQIPALTPREQEIYNLLLGGSSLKEISYLLKIKYETVYFHKNNVFRKLNINSNELLVKYLREPSVNTADGTIPVFLKWVTFADKLGSSLSVSTKIKKSKDETSSYHTISGTLSSDIEAFAGTNAHPDSATLEAMAKMSSFSFKVLGDGNSYAVMITTTETREKGGENHYRKLFTTEKGKTAAVFVNISDLAQAQGLNGIRFGRPVQFNQSNAELFQFEVYSSGNFDLKFWDIRFYA